jgi:hypothetical protein
MSRFFDWGALNWFKRSSMLLPICSESAVSCERAGELVLWAFLEGKREVRADGAVGVPFFMSRALSRMLEMSSLTDGRRAAGESGCVLTAEAALLSLSCCLRMEVANDRVVAAFKGWAARQCLETNATLLVGCLYAVGARNGRRDCEERIMVSRAFMRSIAHERLRPEG